MNDGSLISVFVGDVGEYLADLAKQHDQEATLVTSCNYQKLTPGTYYTSLGDLENLDQLKWVFLQAQEIVYAPPPGPWSDLGGMMQTWTEHYLRMACTYHGKKIVGFEYSSSARLISACSQTIEPRSIESQQIWIAGCSISHGVGVEPDQRYGDIISKHFNLPVTYLTHSGSSISWAADQILRSDIRADDIVLWGITGISRLSYWSDGDCRVHHCPVTSYKRHNTALSSIIRVNYFASEHLKWQSVLAVKQVDNFCRKIKAKLIMATLIAGMENYLLDLDNFISLAIVGDGSSNHRCIDLGTDDLHPGPKSHKFYAESLINKYTELYGPEN